MLPTLRAHSVLASEIEVCYYMLLHLIGKFVFAWTNKVIQKAKLQSSRIEEILLKLYNKKKVMLFLIRAPSIFFL